MSENTYLNGPNREWLSGRAPRERLSGQAHRERLSGRAYRGRLRGRAYPERLSGRAYREKLSGHPYPSPLKVKSVAPHIDNLYMNFRIIMFEANLYHNGSEIVQNMSGMVPGRSPDTSGHFLAVLFSNTCQSTPENHDMSGTPSFLKSDRNEKKRVLKNREY